MKKMILIVVIIFIGISTGRAQLSTVTQDVAFQDTAYTTLNGAIADTSDVIDWSTTYYQAVQWQVVGTTPRVSIVVQTSMQNVDSTFKSVKTLEDSTENANWSDPTALKVAGSKFRRYIVTGLSTNGADTVFRMKEFLLNLPARR